MVISNAMLRVFKMRFGNAEATSFTLDEGGRQYLVTARHVVEEIEDKDYIEIFQNEEWFRLETRLVGKSGDGDIAVLALPQQLTERALEIKFSLEGLMYGQAVHFLGFPYGLYGDYAPTGIGFPLPFVKQAIMSCMALQRDGCLYLDGINNEGFSGGPIVFQNINNSEWQIAGVISGYLTSKELLEPNPTGLELEYAANSGIIQAFPIAKATELIRENPIGILLTT